MADVKSFQVQGNKYNVNPDLTFDNTPTHGSSNPVTSEGIATAIENQAIMSAGRADGSHVGYRSIAYGTNNIAASDYNIVFGKDNTSYSYGSIISGKGNYSLGAGQYGYNGGYNIVSGNLCVATGSYNICTGDDSFIGSKIVNITDSELPTCQEVYIGYIDFSAKKVYYDSEHQAQIDINLPDRNTKTYVFDLTNLPPSRTPGDVYEIQIQTYAYGQPIFKFSKKIMPQYITLTDRCRNHTFLYIGTCYYKAMTDTNYMDSEMTQEVPYDYKSFPMVFLDVNSGELLGYNNNGYNAHWPYVESAPNWSKITLYRGSKADIFLPKGRYAYVKMSTYPSDPENYKVYTSPEYEAGSEITRSLIDGEVVVDITTNKLYTYFFDSTRNIRHIGDPGGNPWGYEGQQFAAGYTGGDGCMALGVSNKTTGSIGSIVAGSGNVIFAKAEGSALFGMSNSSRIYPNHNAGGGTVFITGRNNTIKVTEGFTSYPSNFVSSMIGQQNAISCSGNCNDMTLIGYNNTLQGANVTSVNIIGFYNGASYTTKSIRYSNIIGNNNETRLVQYAVVVGSYNNIGGVENYSQCSLNNNGILSGEGITYNEGTGTYTYEQNRLYEKWGLQSGGLDPQYADNTFCGYYISTDGQTLTQVSDDMAQEQYPIYVFGYGNRYRRKITDIIGGNMTYKYNAMIGIYNSIVTDKMSYSTVVGSNLLVNYPDNTAINNVMFCGVYNSMTGVEGAKFIVGVGSQDNDRHNGLIIYSSGTAVAPIAPDTIQAGIAGITGSSMPSNKMLITYGMLQDYAPKNGGAVGKPSATIVTLTAAGWSNDEQTVSVPGISSGSVVIVQPSGNPGAWYIHEIYLVSQGTDELTFSYSTVPTVDVSVKVVYWA